MNESVWRIELLGGLRAVSVYGEPRTVSRFRTQKTAALFAYLALHRNHPHPREVIQELFWPDETVEAGQNALRVALSSLRKQLELPGTPHGGILETNRTVIGLNAAACTSDVAQFEQALNTRSGSRAADLKSAVSLYGGDFLPGFYEDWILKERDRLRSVYVHSLIELTTHHLSASDYASALDSAQRAARAEPLNEEASRLLMQAHARLGNPQAARQHFNRLVQSLRTEMDIAPSPQTRTLAAQLEQIAEAAGKRADRVEHPPAVPTNIPRAGVTEQEVVSPATVLPFTFTRFFGRERERELLCQLLAPDATAARLVTLTGAGGTGKTRLAIEAARALSDAYQGGVFFVPLTEERDARAIVASIARALRLPRSLSGDYTNAVVAALAAHKVSLLVLDGFEAVAAAGAPVILSLLKAAPALRILATSRRRLELPAEQEFSVSPLPLPDLASVTPEQLRQLPAAQIFIDRAQTAQSDFAVTSRNAADLAAVVASLEGIPLALELAAARIRTVSLARIRAQLAAPDGDRFSLLTARRAGDMTDHHHSLWATIAWSYELLPPPVRRFFAQLAVFRGGWTPEAAQDVCDEPFAAEYLAQLRAHSLVTVGDSTAFEPRFRLLDSLREFAGEQLSRDEKSQAINRHTAFFLQLAENSQEGLRGGTQHEWLERLDADYENLRAVLQRGGSDALLLCGYLRQYWLVHGPLQESAETTAVLLDAEAPKNDTNRLARAAAANTLGALYLRLGEYDKANQRLAESLVLYRIENDEAGMARVRSNQGVLLVRQGDLPSGRAAQEESLEIRLRIGDTWGAAASYVNLGAVAHDMGDLAAANTAYENSLRLCREIDDTRGVGAALVNLANLAASAGDKGVAQSRYAECLSIARTLNNTNGIGIALLNLGGLLSSEPETLPQAEQHFTDAYTLYKKTGEAVLAGAALIELGRTAITQKRWHTAHERLVASLALPLTRVLVCIAVEAFAHLYFETGDASRCVTLYGAVEALRTLSHIPRQTLAHDNLPREHLTALHTQLGEDTFSRCWEQGQTLSQEEACDLARQNLSS